MLGLSSDTVAWLALLVSLGVAVWQIAQHQLEGPRVRVRLRAGYLTDYRLATDPTWDGLARRWVEEKVGGWPVEVFVVEIENAGRTPFTATSPAIEIASNRWWWVPKRRHANAWTFEPREFEGFETKRRVRVEPLDMVRYIITASALLPLLDEHAHGEGSRLRAYVSVAGLRWPRRSSGRKGIRSKGGQAAFAPVPLELGLEVFRAMDQQTRWLPEHASILNIPTALKAREMFRPLESGHPPSADDVEQAIRATGVVLDEFKPFVPLAAYHVAGSLSRLYQVAAKHPQGIAPPPEYRLLEPPPGPGVTPDPDSAEGPAPAH